CRQRQAAARSPGRKETGPSPPGGHGGGHCWRCDGGPGCRRSPNWPWPTTRRRRPPAPAPAGAGGGGPRARGRGGGPRGRAGAPPRARRAPRRAVCPRVGGTLRPVRKLRGRHPGAAAGRHARDPLLRPVRPGAGPMTVPLWAWAAFVAFVVTMLALDLFVLHRRAHQVSLTEAGAWSAVWIALGVGFGGLLWIWRGGGTAQAYLAGYLIEKSLSLDNVFVFTVIFAMFAIPLRYQHRVLMAGIIGALCLRAAFIAGGAALLHSFHVVVYLFGALLLWTAIRMLRSGGHLQPGR